MQEDGSYTAIDLSNDHKPDFKEEKERILKAGSRVTENKVDGTLGVARALGDLQHKCNKKITPEEQAVTANPEIIVKEIDAEKSRGDLIIIACDGIWDCMKSEECV